MLNTLKLTDTNRYVDIYEKNDQKSRNSSTYGMLEKIFKKLQKTGKRKDCNDLNKWIKALINHFWWCCASCDGDATELKEKKWVSILNHIINKHRWEVSSKFNMCSHKKLAKRGKRERKWLVPALHCF